jgi:methylmalonyl-CoA mutase N-terminal domain/subunit
MNDRKFIYRQHDISGDEGNIDVPAGEYPFRRGVHATGYTGKLWTMRMFAGFGTARQTNERFHYLLGQGQTGLSTAFDLPTLMGYDSDHPLSLGEVGKGGVAVDTLDDMRRLFEGIDLSHVSVSMTINGPALVLFAFLIAVADETGVPRDALRGTIQNDCLKEFIAQHEWVVPPKAAMKLTTDIVEFCRDEVPKWNSVSISGYHIREAGASAVQELAFTLANGVAYVEWCVRERNMEVDSFAPRLSFFFDVHNHFFEEVAKIRAARVLWATLMRDRFGAKDPRSWALRTHAQTAGVTLVAQQPLNNVVRVAYQALAAALAGVQSLHTNSYDETYALPTEDAVTLALRTQQILAHETGIAQVVDPLGGSYYVESLTDRMINEAQAIITHVDSLGGMVPAVEQGYPQREIAAHAYRTQHEIESERAVVVGVNRYQASQDNGACDIETLTVAPSVETEQRAQLEAFKRSRNAVASQDALDVVRRDARAGVNVLPSVVEAAKAGCTLGELCDVFREVWGRYTPTSYTPTRGS